MRKSILLVSLIAIALMFTGCNKTQKTEQGDESVASFIDENGKAKSVVLIPSVLFYAEGSLWTEMEGNKLSWAVTLQQGQTLYAYPTCDGSTSEITESKEMQREGKSTKEDYTKVRYNDNDYWINSDLIVLNAEAKVVTENGIVYNGADIADVSSAKVSAGQIVAVYTENTESDEFVKVTFRSDRSYREVYLKSEIISKSNDDMLVSRLLPLLKTIKNPVAKKEVIENLKSLNVCDYYKDMVNDAISAYSEDL